MKVELAQVVGEVPGDRPGNGDEPVEVEVAAMGREGGGRRPLQPLDAVEIERVGMAGEAAGSLLGEIVHAVQREVAAVGAEGGGRRWRERPQPVE